MTKVLIVDDSALYRRVLKDILSGEGYEVEVARDGGEAMIKFGAFQPDLVTLDVVMPDMSGLACLRQIMRRRPCPVVMISSLTTQGATETLKALEMGAVDYAPKPDGVVTLALEAFADLLLEKMRAAQSAQVGRPRGLTARAATPGGEGQGAVAPQREDALVTGEASEGLVLIGTSTGGPVALETVLRDIPSGFPWPIVVAQHMPETFTASLANRLDGLCALAVREVTGPTRLEAGFIYIARGGADLLITRREVGLLALPAPAEARYRWHPSVDRLVASAMDHVAPARLIGVLMTGMGDDGAKTMTALRAAGGVTIAEAEETAVVWGMPRSLIKASGASDIAPLHAIARRLTALAPKR